MLDKTGKALSSTLTGTVSLNFFLAIVLGVSLKRLWLLLSMLQILVHLPLIKIGYPSNTLLLFQLTSDIANLNLIPKETINNFISKVIGVTGSISQARQNFSLLDIFKIRQMM